MNNKVFYQHPNLMRALGMHETVMEVMVNVLSGGDSKVQDYLTEVQSLQERPAYYYIVLFTISFVLIKMN